MGGCKFRARINQISNTRAYKKRDSSDIRRWWWRSTKSILVEYVTSSWIIGLPLKAVINSWENNSNGLPFLGTLTKVLILANADHVRQFELKRWRFIKGRTRGVPNCIYDK